MGARQKLNAAYFCGTLVIATMVGSIAQSFVAFGVAFAILLGVGLYAGDIRTAGRKR